MTAQYVGLGLVAVLFAVLAIREAGYRYEWALALISPLIDRIRALRRSPSTPMAPRMNGHNAEPAGELAIVAVAVGSEAVQAVKSRALIINPSWPHDFDTEFVPSGAVPPGVTLYHKGEEWYVIASIGEEKPAGEWEHKRAVDSAFAAFPRAQGQALLPTRRGDKTSWDFQDLAGQAVAGPYVFIPASHIHGDATAEKAAAGEQSVQVFLKSISDGSFTEDISRISPYEFGADYQLRPYIRQLFKDEGRSFLERGGVLLLGLGVVAAIVLIFILGQDPTPPGG